MVTNRPPGRKPAIDMSKIPIPGGADSGSKYLIGAILAAGQDGCTCTACMLLKKAGCSLTKALLTEDNDGGPSDTQ